MEGGSGEDEWMNAVNERGGGVGRGGRWGGRVKKEKEGWAERREKRGRLTKRNNN
jgi:hypothetical protein